MERENKSNVVTGHNVDLGSYPIGVKPAWIFLEERISSLQEGIARYVRPTESNVITPSDLSATFVWVDELKLRLEELHKIRTQKIRMKL